MPDVNLRLEELNKPSVDAGLLELRAVFDRFDKDSSGHIDRYELRLVLEELGKDPSDKDIEKMLADGDRDGNNLIDWQEFAGMMGHKVDAPMSSEDEDAAVLAEVFKVFDLDGSGFIDRTELKAMMASLETKSFRAPPEEEVDAMLNDADQNRDGKIDYEEFCKVMLEHQNWG